MNTDDLNYSTAGEMLQREKNLKPHPPFNAVHSTCTRKLVSPPTNLKLL